MNQTELRAAIESSFDKLRTAVEDRRYNEVQTILRSQRPLFEGLDFNDSDSFDLLRQGQDLTNWALTLTLVQRTHMERAYASMLRLKQMDSGYFITPVCSADLVDLRG
ncbi:MAG TPA: hypothetical protein VH325_04915 [Bryobacteraceae bacterium]|jgi:hypothetical protein|nr:hypothetical protein [Bryobacteraceae bacterium]